jgi:hypothetical protein
MNLQSIFGGIAIGKDLTGNFRQSLKGLAVRRTDDKFVTLDGDFPIEISDFTFDGTEQYVYRLPVQNVKPGDIVITSESPLKVLFVREVEPNGRLVGLDPCGIEINYTPTTNLFNMRFFVTVVSILDGLSESVGGGAEGLLPLLLLSNKGGSRDTDNLTTLLMLQTLGGSSLGNNNLLPLLLLNGGSDALETMLLLNAQGNAGNPFGNLLGNSASPEPRKTGRTKQRKVVKR